MDDYTLKKSTKRRTIGLKVDHNGLTVYAPERCTQKEIDYFISLKSKWIQKHLTHYASVKSQEPTFEHGSEFLYMGNTLMLDIIPAEKLHIIPSETMLHIHTPNTQTGYIKRMISHWYQAQAKLICEAKTHEAAALLGKTVHKISFGKYKSKWGSCSHDAHIKYNWLLMRAPEPVIDYVIAHEVSHLVEMNHSPAFWRVVESICPEYQSQRKWLKEHSAMVHFEG